MDDRIGRLVLGQDIPGKNDPLLRQEYGNIAATVRRCDVNQRERNSIQRYVFSPGNGSVGQVALLDLPVDRDERRRCRHVVRRSDNLGADVFVGDDSRVRRVGGQATEMVGIAVGEDHGLDRFGRKFGDLGDLGTTRIGRALDVDHDDPVLADDEAGVGRIALDVIDPAFERMRDERRHRGALLRCGRARERQP